MFYTDGKLQYPVRVETPDPVFARALQQAIGGVEGEIRVCMQYFFQAMGARGRTFVTSRFPRQAFTDRVLSIYAEVAAGRAQAMPARSLT